MTEKNQIVKTPGADASTILLGAVGGAIAGMIVANLLHRNAKSHGRDSIITPAEGAQLGLLIFGLFKAISNMGAKDK